MQAEVCGSTRSRPTAKLRLMDYASTLAACIGEPFAAVVLTTFGSAYAAWAYRGCATLPTVIPISDLGLEGAPALIFCYGLLAGGSLLVKAELRTHRIRHALLSTGKAGRLIVWAGRTTAGLGVLAAVFLSALGFCPWHRRTLAHLVCAFGIFLLSPMWAAICRLVLTRCCKLASNGESRSVVVAMRVNALVFAAFLLSCCGFFRHVLSRVGNQEKTMARLSMVRATALDDFETHCTVSWPGVSQEVFVFEWAMVLTLVVFVGSLRVVQERVFSADMAREATKNR